MPHTRLVVFFLAFAAVQGQAAEHPALRWGAPDTGHLIVRDGYVLSYDGRLRGARWVPAAVPCLPRRSYFLAHRVAGAIGFDTS